MRKYYKMAEMIMALREEYNECRELLAKMDELVSVDGGICFYHFNGRLSDRRTSSFDDRGVRLYVQRKYNAVLKKIQDLRFHSIGFYRAIFNSQKDKHGIYTLKQIEGFEVPSLERNRYRPEVEITDQKEFSELMDELLTRNIMQVKDGYFSFNGDSITLDFDHCFITSETGAGTTLTWDGPTDTIDYSVKHGYYPSLIDMIFDYQIPVDEMSPEWVKLLEKHEKDFDDEILFDTDVEAQSSTGTLYIASTNKNNGIVRLELLKK